MNKKALACLLAAAMTISLTACGGGDKKTSDKATKHREYELGSDKSAD